MLLLMMGYHAGERCFQHSLFPSLELSHELMLPPMQSRLWVVVWHVQLFHTSHPPWDSSWLICHVNCSLSVEVDSATWQ